MRLTPDTEARIKHEIAVNSDNPELFLQDAYAKDCQLLLDEITRLKAELSDSNDKLSQSLSDTQVLSVLTNTQQEEVNKLKAELEALNRLCAKETGLRCLQINKLEAELEAERNAHEATKTILSGNGHNAPCHYCGEECNSLSGDPGEWPVALTHSDVPGVAKWHHAACVTTKLQELADLKAKLENAPVVWFVRSVIRDETYLRKRADDSYNQVSIGFNPLNQHPSESCNVALVKVEE